MSGKADIKMIEERLAEREVSVIGKHKFFSVMIPIVEGKDGASFLFEVRAGQLRSQPGDVCFPGGTVEPDETALECAVREFREETGIPAVDLRVLGQFDTLYGFSGYTLYTFVGRLEEKSLKKLSPNPTEVERVFTVPFDFFRSVKPRVYELDVVSKTEDFPYEETGVSPDYNWRVGKNVLPVYRYENEVIWGMTARVVSWFADKVLR